MPLLLLLVLAFAAGCAAALLSARYPHRAEAPAVEAIASETLTGRRALLAARRDPETATGLALTLALGVILGGGLVLAVLAVVVRGTHDLAGIDSSVAHWGARHATAFSTQGLKLVTDLGETWLVAIVGVVVAVADWVRTRNRWVVPFLLAVVAGDKLVTSVVKHLVDRVRPDLNPIAATLGPSFPSGHSSTAAAFWAAAALVAGRWWGRRAWPALTGAAVGIAVAVAASRVLLDVHWLTDVIAGLALGWAWFAACAVAFGGRVLRFGAASEDAGRPAAAEQTAPVDAGQPAPAAPSARASG